MRHVVFTQNNEHATQFLGKYDYSVALISYWLNGIPTLEENNHMTNPFYLYFFRNLFMRDFDYYVSNINLFTHPQLHLYPMLGVRQLISDVPTSNSEEFTLGGEIFFESRFSNYNFGQYSPKQLISVDSAREAISVMGKSSFDPTYEYVSLRGDMATFEFKGASTGSISYDKNAVIFNGEAETDEETMHVLPILFSNCLESSAGNSLIRVNLLLTGIIFSGDTRDKISFEGPPFHNECLKTDIFDVETYGLRDMKYPYPLDADRPAIREFFASPWR